MEGPLLQAAIFTTGNALFLDFWAFTYSFVSLSMFSERTSSYKTMC
jgi:hypothetical protein